MEKINSAVFERLLSWWEGLEEDRASRAMLKRAHSLTAVTLSPPYQALHQQLLLAGWHESDTPEQSVWNDKLAMVAGLLVHVSGEIEGGRQRSGTWAPARAMSWREAGEDRPAVSELRFMRLLQSPDLDSLFTGLRRVLPLVGNRINIKALAEDLIYWGEHVRKRWAYQYVWPEKPDHK